MTTKKELEVMLIDQVRNEKYWGRIYRAAMIAFFLVGLLVGLAWR